ncbi:MAG TPA: PilZ domain-containing protein [Terriglobia bacterium]|nr:PilZ domain-containing protein [Terriglobia bacterium]
MAEEPRRSERVWTQLAVEIAGEDGTGRAFVEEARTAAVSRHGAMIVTERKLFPNQEISVRCLSTGREASARVVGMIRKESVKSFYGIELQGDSAGIWGIEFPPPGDPETTVGRILLQCQACKTQEVAYLNDFELEVLEANQSLARHCKRCGDATTWKKIGTGVVQPPASAKPSKPSKELRREPRRNMRVAACIRCHQFASEDLVDTRNVSRGGLCFASTRVYAPGWTVEVAVPYSGGGGNIFLAGRIARAQYLTSENIKLYGVAYTRKQG